ncbi:MAG: methyltransferase, partial [Mycetocola sp.]
FLTEATATDATGLTKLLRYLAELGLVEYTGTDSVRLTPLGQELDDSDVSDDLDLDGFAATQELTAALSLLTAIRTGVGNATRWVGEPWTQRTQRPGRMLTERVNREAEDALYATGPLATHPALGTPARIALLGQGQGVIAAALVTEHPQTQVTIVASPSEINALSDEHAAHPRVGFQVAGSLTGPQGTHDVVLLNAALEALPDLDAIHLLRVCTDVVPPSGRVLVFTDVLDPTTADDHDFEHDLISFALSGGAARTDAEYRALFASAGLITRQIHTVGWGNTLYELELPPAHSSDKQREHRAPSEA